MSTSTILLATNTTPRRVEVGRGSFATDARRARRARTLRVSLFQRAGVHRHRDALEQLDVARHAAERRLADAAIAVGRVGSRPARRQIAARACFLFEAAVQGRLSTQALRGSVATAWLDVELRNLVRCNGNIGKNRHRSHEEPSSDESLESRSHGSTSFWFR